MKYLSTPCCGCCVSWRWVGRDGSVRVVIKARWYSGKPCFYVFERIAHRGLSSAQPAFHNGLSVSDALGSLQHVAQCQP